MTHCKQIMYDVTKAKEKPKINLPNGETSNITGVGKVRLCNDLNLKNAMLIPNFRHNLLSVQKLSRDSNCKVVFLSHYCVIQDKNTSKVKRVGKAVKGLYYLQDEPVYKMIAKVKEDAEQPLKKMNKGEEYSALTAQREVEKTKKSGRC